MPAAHAPATARRSASTAAGTPDGSVPPPWARSGFPPPRPPTAGANAGTSFPAASPRSRAAGVVATTNDSLARTLTARDMPATDVLIVGDHMPPFFDHRSRNRFRPDAVPWILLRARTH